MRFNKNILCVSKVFISGLILSFTSFQVSASENINKQLGKESDKSKQVLEKKEIMLSQNINAINRNNKLTYKISSNKVTTIVDNKNKRAVIISNTATISYTKK